MMDLEQRSNTPPEVIFDRCVDLCTISVRNSRKAHGWRIAFLWGAGMRSSVQMTQKGHGGVF